MEVQQELSIQEDSPDVISLVTRPVVGRSLPVKQREININQIRFPFPVNHDDDEVTRVM